jgi:hypothetical protein
MTKLSPLESNLSPSNTGIGRRLKRAIDMRIR